MSEDQNYDEFYWRLKKIADLDGSDYGKMPTRKNILAGCFDVWHSEEDRISQQKQADFLLKRIKDAGLAINHPYRKDGSIEWGDCWFLTKKGKEVLENKISFSVEEELEKCRNSFEYFCKNYIKILSPQSGTVNFIPHGYQNRCVSNYLENKSNVISKFRQGGFTTLNAIFCLWKAMFYTNQRILFSAATDSCARYAGNIVDRAIENMPDWMKPKKGKYNDHVKELGDAGNVLMFFSVAQSIGRDCNFLVLEEVAFVEGMADIWNRLYAQVQINNGSCVVVSTHNKGEKGVWFKKFYESCKDRDSIFNIIDVDFWEHPDYNPITNPSWVKEVRKNLGDKAFAIEVMRCFL